MTIYIATKNEGDGYEIWDSISRAFTTLELAEEQVGKWQTQEETSSKVSHYSVVMHHVFKRVPALPLPYKGKIKGMHFITLPNRRS
jgi:hypothetical protein